MYKCDLPGMFAYFGEARATYATATERQARAATRIKLQCPRGSVSFDSLLHQNALDHLRATCAEETFMSLRPIVADEAWPVYQTTADTSADVGCRGEALVHEQQRQQQLDLAPDIEEGWHHASAAGDGSCAGAPTFFRRIHPPHATHEDTVYASGCGG